MNKKNGMWFESSIPFLLLLLLEAIIIYNSSKFSLYIHLFYWNKSYTLLVFIDIFFFWTELNFLHFIFVLFSRGCEYINRRIKYIIYLKCFPCHLTAQKKKSLHIHKLNRYLTWKTHINLKQNEWYWVRNKKQ